MNIRWQKQSLAIEAEESRSSRRSGRVSRQFREMDCPAVLNGQKLIGGSTDIYQQTGSIVSEELNSQAEELAEEGKTPLFFATERKLLGIIAVADVIKEDSPQAVRELQNMGIHVVMLTGDNERTAKAIGAQAGVDEVIAGVLPDGKESSDP